MNGKLFSIVITLFFLIFSLGFVQASDDDVALAGEWIEEQNQSINTNDKNDSSANKTSTDTNDTQDDSQIENILFHGGDENNTTLNTYNKAAGNPSLALMVVGVCLVLMRHKD